MRLRFVILFVVLSIILGACGTEHARRHFNSLSQPIPPSLRPTPIATPTVPLAILVLPADLDAEASNLYQKTVYDLAQECGLALSGAQLIKRC